MMDADGKSQEKSENQINKGTSTEEKNEKGKIEEEAVVEENPDVDDPRLYSPLQEPDRPDPGERKAEDSQD